VQVKEVFFALHPPAGLVLFLKKYGCFRSKEMLILRAPISRYNALAGRFLTLWHGAAKKAHTGVLTPVQGSVSFSVLSTITLHGILPAVFTGP
jgi:hypothetical protein